ncbi:SDR family NAD(P)-dependent oxidoreductase [Vitiosangium sp. GDMCC 1.1324]|uniref:SDR family NAD(P)-dependent oxidoreductase n=1 Tax=Vitiosangium sp. (strain GDMCC 1.1324) TaxID=2138576 RepID=UPI000D3AB4EC|nr:SDR family NAD(P)-dependent oxidoreductase [Vitiosangium sp. GDMCC 1.1324]PTL82023.1 short-chain dehydrogenase [Vitiosangium sp. GDMCC 1.1324]
MNIKGSIALVTGANRGIGRTYVKALLDRGAAKVYAAARDTASLADLAADPRVVPLALDVTNAAQIAAAARTASDVTLLVNNAGVANGGDLLRADVVQAARQEMEVNYLAPLALAQAFAPALAAAGGGGVINVLSFLSLAAPRGSVTYSASKAASLFMTRGLRAFLAGQGTRVVATMPVQVETDMGRNLPEPRLTPEEVVAESLDSLENGVDEHFPGELSRRAHTAFTADPKGFQARFLAGGAQ